MNTIRIIVTWAWYLSLAFCSQAALGLRAKGRTSFVAWFRFWHVNIVKRNFVRLILFIWLKSLFGGSKRFIFVSLQLIFHLLLGFIKTRSRALPFKSLMLSNLHNLVWFSPKHNSIEERFHSFGSKSWRQFFIFSV